MFKKQGIVKSLGIVRLPDETNTNIEQKDANKSADSKDKKIVADKPKKV